MNARCGIASRTSFSGQASTKVGRNRSKSGPIGISILNVLPGIVASVGARTGPSVDVRIAVGNGALTARITHRSLRELGIEKGLHVYALVKAVSLDLRD